MSSIERRPTVHDVAAEAGVSYQPVSRVFNHPELVSPGTLARVQAAIDELGYTPNTEARALREQGIRNQRTES